MEIKTKVKAGKLAANHNTTGSLKPKTDLKAVRPNHNARVR
jgi:hypothetical protein